MRMRATMSVWRAGTRLPCPRQLLPQFRIASAPPQPQPRPRLLHALALAMGFALVFSLTGCETSRHGGRFEGIHSNRIAAMNEAIRLEPPGDYYVGRRYYKRDYKFWGYVRKPGQPWSSAKLVMMNEQQKLAPDRERGTLGSDHNFEYRLYGEFSADPVYEPASNTIYPEFVLKRYELVTANPPPLMRSAAANDPMRRVLDRPR